MDAARWIRIGVLTGATVAAGAIACGSGDSARRPTCTTARCDDDGGDGTGGAEPGTGGKGAGANGGSGGADGGDTSAGGSSSGGGVSDAGNGGADASSGGDGAGGDAGISDAGDASDAAPFVCPAGTADCGGDPTDCETNIATDASNCGRCDRVCGATAACTGGLCAATIILDPPAGIPSNWCGSAFSATKAYMITCWGDNDLSEVRVANLEPGADIGGTRIRSYINVAVVALRGILIDGNDVYYGLEATPNSNLWKFPLNATGTADVTVGVTAESSMRFDELQLVGDTYYWADNTHTVPGQYAPASIYKRKKTDTSSTKLVPGIGLIGGLKVTPTKLLWLESRGTTANVRAYSAPLAGIAAATDARELGLATPGSYMSKQGEYVYWTVKSTKPAGKLVRVKYADDTAPVEDVATDLDRPEGLVTDAAYAYFKQVDALYRVPLTGGTAEQLSPVVPAHDAQATTIFHVDDRYVYFAADPGFGTSTLVRVAK